MRADSTSAVVRERRTRHHRVPGSRRGRGLFRGTADRERGAALIEGAIVAPIMFLLIFGLLDGAWALFGDHVVRSSASDGVRAVSALANDSDADYWAVQAVKRDIDGLDRANLRFIVVYKATGFGSAPSATCRAGTSVSTGSQPCNVYRVADLTRPKGQWGCQTSSPDRYWCPNVRKTATTGTNSPPDYVGVWVSATHKPLTRVVISSTRNIERQSVLRIEPRTTQ